MWIFCEHFKAKMGRLRRLLNVVVKLALSFVVTVPLLANCMIASSQIGPERPITIDDDVSWLRDQTQDDLKTFYQLSPAQQALRRNEIVTVRMYIVDMEYHKYEARLTREMQEEGLAATATSLGLTTTASLIPVAQTSRLLSGIATGVTGLDKAYDEKQLLSNTMQALQTQMRADRKTQAAAIQASMIDPKTKAIIPITEYTLPMALSDVETYYQAGTIASALVGLSKTVAEREKNAQQAKSDSGPNPQAVSQVRSTANPTAPTAPPTIKASQAVAPTPPPSSGFMLGGMTDVEKRTSKSLGMAMQGALCVSADGNFGDIDSPTRLAIAQFKAGFANRQLPTQFGSSDETIRNFGEQIRLTVTAVKNAKPSLCSGPNPAFELGKIVGGH
jgi:hypothetical protein